MSLTKYEIVKMAREAGGVQLFTPRELGAFHKKAPDIHISMTPEALERFATLCRAPLVAEVERLEQWHAEMADNRNAIASERDTLKAELARVRAVEPTTEQLTVLFTKESGGPNPYYRCRNCGKTEPGLQEYLAAHWKTCAPPQPAAQESTSAVPVVEQLLSALMYHRDQTRPINTTTEAIAAGQKFIKENGK